MCARKLLFLQRQHPCGPFLRTSVTCLGASSGKIWRLVVYSEVLGITKHHRIITLEISTRCLMKVEMIHRTRAEMGFCQILACQSRASRQHLRSESLIIQEAIETLLGVNFLFHSLNCTIKMLQTVLIKRLIFCISVLLEGMIWSKRNRLWVIWIILYGVSMDLLLKIMLRCLRWIH